ncbi:MAG: chromate transporter [Ruminococcaceae bacterium]|nr:chromate transporter [Oscillospiraceae bacterium]
MNDLLLMCLEFLKTGFFAVGGGLATIPFLKEMSINHPEWFSLEELANMIAVAESTPGPIGVNVATYAGYQTFGVLGGILATLSLTLPSFLVILLVSAAWEKYKTNEKVQKVFTAIRAAAIGLIVSAGYSVLVGAVSNVVTGIIFVIMFIALQLPKTKKLHPIVYIVFATVLGIILKL